MLVYAEIADTQRRLGLFDEAAMTVEQMLAKYPDREVGPDPGVPRGIPISRRPQG